MSMDDKQILAALDIRAEYAALGVRVNGQVPSADGWLPCHAIGREDRNPSAAINLQTGRYRDHGGEGDSLSLFDFAAKHGGFSDWRSARDHFAEKAGKKATTPAKRSKRQSRIYATSKSIVDGIIRYLTKKHGAGVKFVKAWDYGDFHVLRFDLPTPAGEKQRVHRAGSLPLAD